MYGLLVGSVVAIVIGVVGSYLSYDVRPMTKLPSQLFGGVFVLQPETGALVIAAYALYGFILQWGRSSRWRRSGFFVVVMLQLLGFASVCFHGKADWEGFSDSWSNPNNRASLVANIVLIFSWYGAAYWYSFRSVSSDGPVAYQAGSARQDS